MNRQQFQESFAASLQAIAQAEHVTKRELKHVSRHLLIAIHGIEDATLTGDIQFINMLLNVLTPMNKKTAVLFFKEFTGFHFDDKENVFTKKNAKLGPQAAKDAIAFLADPNNNIWSWAERNVEIERKPFAISKLTKIVEKAIEANISQVDILNAVLEGGVDVEAILELMKRMEEEAKA